MKSSSGYKIAGLMLVVAIGFGWWFWHPPEPAKPPTLLLPYTPAELAQWPWRQIHPDALGRGITHWLTKQRDGTTIDLVEFDFQANPTLRFALYDQDEDDAKPFDNVVDYWPMGVGQATWKLNRRFQRLLSVSDMEEGRYIGVAAAWNGLFFGYYRKTKPGNRNGISEKAGHHVAPVILDGKVHYTRSNYRWCFGVKYVNRKPIFKVLHKPDSATMAREFDYGSGGAQCLILNGKPLRLQPFPRTREEILKGPVASTPADAGHIPVFDHMRTCRTSMAWSPDSSRFYLLLVKEPDSEGSSIVAFRNGKPDSGGWTVADVQRFWLSLRRSRPLGSAVNIDAGGVAQMALMRPDKTYDYDVVPGQEESTAQRLQSSSSFTNAPRGGSIMYFYVAGVFGEGSKRVAR